MSPDEIVKEKAEETLSKMPPDFVEEDRLRTSFLAILICHH